MPSRATIPDELWDRIERERLDGLLRGEGYHSNSDAIQGLIREALRRREEGS